MSWRGDEAVAPGRAPTGVLELWAEAPLDCEAWTDVHDGKLSAVARELLAARERIALAERVIEAGERLALIARSRVATRGALEVSYDEALAEWRDRGEK